MAVSSTIRRESRALLSPDLLDEYEYSHGFLALDSHDDSHDVLDNSHDLLDKHGSLEKGSTQYKAVRAFIKPVQRSRLSNSALKVSKSKGRAWSDA